LNFQAIYLLPSSLDLLLERYPSNTSCHLLLILLMSLCWYLHIWQVSFLCQFYRVAFVVKITFSWRCVLWFLLSRLCCV
jgi:hypothetical protein